MDVVLEWSFIYVALPHIEASFRLNGLQTQSFHRQGTRGGSRTT